MGGLITILLIRYLLCSRGASLCYLRMVNLSMEIILLLLRIVSLAVSWIIVIAIVSKF
jgi:hypothetical protein